MKLRVVFFNPFTLVNRPARRTYAKAQIPHRPRKLRNQRAKLFFDFVIRKEKKDIQVGVREKHLPAVTAERQQSESFRFGVVQSLRVLEHLLKAAVGELAQSEQGL